MLVIEAVCEPQGRVVKNILEYAPFIFPDILHLSRKISSKMNGVYSVDKRTLAE
jgi:hypothetical protein